MQAEANLVRLALIVVLQKRCRNLEPVKALRSLHSLRRMLAGG